MTILALALSPALGATFNVNSTADIVDAAPGNGVCATVGGVCTLRAAIQEANALAGADTINLPTGTYTLTITGTNEDASAAGDLDITGPVTIAGAGRSLTIISAGGIDRVFDHRSAVTSSISDLTIRDGFTGNDGGGIRILNGNVTLTRVLIASNTGNNGGAVNNVATVTIVDSELRGNTAGSGNGGGLWSKGPSATVQRSTITGNSGGVGGGVWVDKTATAMSLTNVTISGNSANNNGAGIYVDQFALAVTNVTITGNTAGNHGGAIFRESLAPLPQLRNVIVADNTSRSGNCNASMVTLGGNLDSGSTCGFTGPGDKINTDPRLGPLQDNGGPTPTHALKFGSPAIDGGTNTGCPALDQRSVGRPIGGTCDIGAVEMGQYTLSGTVFEDVNYGGGAGRSLAASSGVGRAGARVELFDPDGAFLTSTTTGAGGGYTFTVVVPDLYTVRVVSSTVTSSRPGAVAGLLPVQTFRVNATSGTPVADPNRVGGEDPTKVDAGNGSTTLAALTTATTTAQSIAPVTISAANVAGVNFGFNFDTIVSTRDSGQGSLRQFLLNSNALGNAGLAQVGQAAGVETSLFMIPNGSAVPGLRADLTPQLTAGVAVISVTTLLPTITDASTRVDGTTQTANVGNTNDAVLGAGGTVGVDALPLGQVAGPEVRLRDGAALTIGLRIAANNIAVRGMAIHGFGGANGEGAIRIDDNFTGTLIENNLLGSIALSFTDPGDAERGECGVHSEGGDNGTIRNNLIGFHRVRGIFLVNTSSGWTISGNEIRDSGLNTQDGDGIALNGSSSNAITGNLIVGSSSQGIVVAQAGSTGNTFTNNTVSGNGVGLPSGVLQSTGITMRSPVTSVVLDRNVISANYGAGVQVNNGSTGIRMRRNSFFANGTITARSGGGPTGQIGIDLNAPGDNPDLGTAPFVTINDAGDPDAGGNDLLNYPILESAGFADGALTLQGFARPGSVIELFAAAPDPSGFGEGQTWKITLTEGGTGAGGDDPYPDTDATTGTYGPAAINGLFQGEDTTNRFSFTFPAPAGVGPGTVLTATATLGAVGTSEFSGNVTVTALPGIYGTVFEDVAGDGLPGGQSAGDAANPGRPGVSLTFWRDGGDGLPNGTDDVNAGSATTTAAGAFGKGLAAGTYWVLVDSKTVSPSAGLRGGFAQGDVWAEQTWGPVGALCADGAGGTAPPKGGAGPCYGGRRGAQSDSAAALSSAEHVTRVVVAASDISNVDIGLSFNVVTDARDGDDDLAANRSVQGSLRQFLQNANAITGANAMRFVPAVATNASGGGGSWWRVSLAASPLPAITDASATIDGTATCAWMDGTQGCASLATVRDTNPGESGNPELAGKSVGTGADGVEGTGDEPSLPSYPRPELAIDGADRGVVLDAGAGSTTIRRLAVFNAPSHPAAIRFTAGTGGLVTQCFVGPRADGSDPGAGSRAVAGVEILGGTADVTDSFIAHLGGAGINSRNATLIRGNEIYRTALASTTADGLSFEGSTGQTITVRQNRIDRSGAYGIESWMAPGPFVIEENTVRRSGQSGGVENGGIRIFGAGSTVSRNVVAENAGAGIVLVQRNAPGSNQRNRLSRNAVYQNGGIGIDLDVTNTGLLNPNGDGVTGNDGAAPATLPNLAIDYPVISAAWLAGGTLHVRGYVGTSAVRIPGPLSLELFKADDDGNNNGPVEAGDGLSVPHGEGRRFLGECASAADGTFACDLTVPLLVPLAVGDAVTATASDDDGNTSELGANRTLQPLAVVKRAFFYDDLPIPNGATLPRGIPIKFLLYVNNPGGTAIDVSLRDLLEPAFVYVPGSMRFSDAAPACAGSACTQAEEAAILASADDTGTIGTDAVDADVVSFAGSTLDAGDQIQSNARLDIPSGRVWALVFTVRVQ